MLIYFVPPGTFTDRLTEISRDGGRALLAQAIEIELTTFSPQSSTASSILYKSRTTIIGVSDGTMRPRDVLLKTA